MKLLLSLFIILTFSLCAHSAQTELSSTVKKRQTVAIVLAGGGAKGAAHAGVLQRLEEMRIPVDFITGTSIGAYVGGLYATGLSADEIKTLLLTQDWNQGYIDRANRSQRSLRSKAQGDRYQVHTDLGIQPTTVQAPTGLLQGQSMLAMLRETTGNITSVDSFDHLAIPYRAIATDIATMQADVLDGGYLPDAMMASMSIPALLPPFELNGKRYIDGGVTDNLPILAAKQLGADIIIAVDVSSAYKDKSQLDGMLNMIDQLSIHMVKRSTISQTNTLTKNDIYLRPNVGHIETTDFSSMSSALEQGYLAAIEVSEKLSSLSLSETEYVAYQSQKKLRRQNLLKKQTFSFDDIIINNKSHYQTETLLHTLGLTERDEYSAKNIEAAIAALYALDNFELVTYQIKPNDQQTILVVNVTEKSWGPNYLDFRIHVEEDFNANSIYSIGAKSHFTNINQYGGEAWLGVDLGTSKRIDAEILQPITVSNKLTIGAGIHYLSDKGNVMFSRSTRSFNEGESDFVPFSLKSTKSEIELGAQLQPWQEVSLGYSFEFGDTSLAPIPTLGEVEYQRQGFYSEYKFDTLDHLTFPTRGMLAHLSMHRYDDNYQITGQSPQDTTTNEITSTLRLIKSVGRHTLDAKMEYGVIDTEEHSIALSPLRLGGFLNLSGMPRDSLAGREKAYGGLTYRYKWSENDFGLFQSPVYFGASLEKGGVWQDTSLKINQVDMYRSSAIYIGVNSPLGTIVVSYSRVDKGNDAFYLIVGAPLP